MYTDGRERSTVVQAKPSISSACLEFKNVRYGTHLFVHEKFTRTEKKHRVSGENDRTRTSRYLRYQVYKKMTVLTLGFLLFTLISFQPSPWSNFESYKSTRLFGIFVFFLYIFFKPVWTGIAIHTLKSKKLNKTINFFSYKMFTLFKCSRVFT